MKGVLTTLSDIFLKNNPSSAKTIVGIFANTQSQVLKEIQDFKKWKNINYLLPPTLCLLKKDILGLPWRLSGKESAC